MQQQEHFFTNNFFNVLPNITALHYTNLMKIGAQMWVLQNVLHFSGYAANMQQYTAALAF